MRGKITSCLCWHHWAIKEDQRAKIESSDWFLLVLVSPNKLVTEFSLLCAGLPVTLGIVRTMILLPCAVVSPVGGCLEGKGLFQRNPSMTDN